jgi:hypothetical protein
MIILGGKSADLKKKIELDTRLKGNSEAIP